ncbi:VOC family protein [Candidatus Poribacteria bacterium]|nr:VOC family protein [Candidatus Poribacteria bacterium]
MYHLKNGLSIGRLKAIAKSREALRKGKLDMAVKGYAEIAIVVSDLDKAKVFYCDLLEIPLVDYQPDRNLTLKLGRNQYMGLWLPGTWHSNYMTADDIQKYAGACDGRFHFVFEVDPPDVDRLCRKLANAGVKVYGPVLHADGASHAYFNDPFRHAVELWGR